MYQALEQFKILNLLITNNIYISNYILILLVLVFFTQIIYYNTKLKNMMYIVKNIFQWILEFFYFFILDLLKQNIGFKGIKYFPLLLNVFYFIYFLNIGGLVGYNLQLTSHIFVTFSLSISLFIGIIFLGINNFKKTFF